MTSAVTSSYEQQYSFLETAAVEAGEIQRTPLRQGPHWQAFQNEITWLADQMDSLQVPHDAWQSPSYQSPETRSIVSNLSFNTAVELTRVMNLRRGRLAQIAVNATYPSLTQNPLHDNILTTPPYRHQGETHITTSIATSQTCTQAIFRMLFEDITGEYIDEGTLFKAVKHVYGSHLVEDDQLLRIFKSPIFKETYGKKIDVISCMGADFNRINQYYEALSKKEPIRMYAAISFASTASVDALHTLHSSVLLDSDNATVRLHDPSFREVSRKNNKVMLLSKFATRWAMGYNRANLVVDWSSGSQK